MEQNSKTAIEEIANLKLKDTFSIGQDFINNQLLYGVKFNDKSYILSSNKKFLRLMDCEKDLNLIPKHKEVEMSKISSETIQNFITGKTETYLSPKNLFLLIKSYITDYIFFEDKRNYDVLSLWIILSYCYTIFSYIPYLHLKGDKGVGKSSLLTILKNTCFNATMWSNVTEAVIFRYIDVSNATLLIDEAEDLKNPKNKGLNGILNAGFNKEGSVPRTRMFKNSEKVIQYSSFSMKALAGINDIPNVLKDRCINIQMSKKPKNIQKKKYIDTSKNIIQLNNTIIQNLYIFSLLHCNDIYKIYENTDFVIPDCLSARDIDIFLPLFSIAKFIDNSSNSNDIEKTLYDYSESMSKTRNEQDIEENLSYKLISDLYYMIIEKKLTPYKDIYFLNDNLFNYLKNKCEYIFQSKNSLTKALNTLQIKHTRIDTSMGKKTYYIITLEHLEKLIDSYNISIPETIKESDINLNNNTLNY